jgi:hypothetical protein
MVRATLFDFGDEKNPGHFRTKASQPKGHVRFASESGRVRHN